MPEMKRAVPEDAGGLNLCSFCPRQLDRFLPAFRWARRPAREGQGALCAGGAEKPRVIALFLGQIANPKGGEAGAEPCRAAGAQATLQLAVPARSRAQKACMRWAGEAT